MLKRKGVCLFWLGMSVFLFLTTGCGAPRPEETKELPYLQESADVRESAGQSSLPAEREPAGASGTGEQGTEKTTTVVLYFADNNGYLAAYRKEVPKVTGIARLTLHELCQGPPADSGLYPTIPPGAALKDINIKEDGLAVVDFNQNLKSKHWGGSTAELLTVYSIVNTLTQFPAVKKVQIFIEGERVQTLAGHLDISKPLQRDGSLIKAGKDGG